MSLVKRTMCIVVCLCVWFNGYSQSRIGIAAITPSINTGMDYTPWLNDDTTNLVTNVWASINNQYIDVKLKLATSANINSLSLYHYEGDFDSDPAYIYAIHGSTKTLLGTFQGNYYLQWVSLNLSTPLLTDTIEIHKYGNNIPEKIKIYGTAVSLTLSTPITGYAIACTGATTSLGDATGGGTWSSSNTSIATVNTSGIVTGISTGTATISYTATGGYATQVVTINPSPIPGSITGTATICPVGTTTFSDAASGGIWSSSAAAVATVGATGIVTGVSPGTATISYTVTNWCGSRAATQLVTVNPAPNAGTITGTTSLCPAGTTALTDAAGGGTWRSSAPAIATVGVTGNVTGVAAGAATISYTVSGACGSRVATQAVTVNAAPNAGSIAGASAICTGGTSSFTDAVGGGVWSSSAPAVATIGATGIVTGVSAGLTNVSYTVSNSCGSRVATQALTVNSLPNPGTITGTATVSTGSSTTLSDAVTGGVWSTSTPGVATISTSGVVSGLSAGSSAISYTVTNSCGSRSATQVVTVNSSSSATILSTPITGYAIACTGATTSLGDATGGGTWSSNNTSIATVNSYGIVTGISPGTAIISYNASAGYATQVVTVNPSANTGTITGMATVCTLGTTALNDAAGGGAWSSSATAIATVGATGIVSGISPGTAIISYTVTNWCGPRSATQVVSVTSGTATAGSISGATAVCPGGTIVLTDAVSGGSWSCPSTGIASVSSTGMVAGISSGTATISYSVSTSCGSALATQVISVNSLPNAGSITGASTLCPGSATSLTDVVSGGAWSSSSSPVATVTTAGLVTGVTTGTAIISYTLTNICGSIAATHSININTVPGAGVITGAATVNVGATTTLNNTTTGGAWGCAATGIATVGTTGVVTGVSTGSATVSYTVTGSCGTATATQAVTVNPATVSSGLVYGMIPIDSNRWYQLDNCSNGLGGLFDGILGVNVLTGWGKILTNYDSYYPVLKGEQINIDSIKFYSGTGSISSTPFTLYYIDSLWNKIEIASFVGGIYDAWVGPNPSSPYNFTLSTPANNIKYLVINSYGAFPTEMRLYGSYAAPTALAAQPAKTITLGKEFGVNGFEWNFENPSSPLVPDTTRMAAAKSFTGLRHYLDWQKLEPFLNQYTFNPSHSGGWNYDTMYAQCKADGIEVLADIKTLPNWLLATYPTSMQNAENVPVPYDSDFSNPRSYLLQARVAFQFAARYGSNASVSSSLLSVDDTTRWTGDPANTVKKGLGLIKYIECDNERDKWWFGTQAYQTGRQYAANLSAFYDGNKNTMGPGVGVKNADPSMKVVMCGVALPTTDYLRGMIDWCKEYRGYNSDGSVNLCWDIINYHLYCDNGGSIEGSGTMGAAPEVAHADTFANNFIKAAHAYANDMPVWVTETGYDINPSSIIRAYPIGSKTALQTQADWILRTSLLNARMGVERTFFYEMYDDDSIVSTKFSSSGLINSNKSRRPAADYLYQANKLMGNYVYQETISTNPVVDRYALGGQSVYVLVKPSQNGSTTSYTLNVGASGVARIYAPTIGQDSMNVTTASTVSNTITLTVGETPVFVMAPATSTGREAASVEQTSVPNTVQQSDIKVYPNPTVNSINLSIDNESEGDVNVMVYDEAGRLSKNLVFNKTPGNFTQSIDLSGLPSGLYIMEIDQNNEKVIKKILKVNK